MVRATGIESNGGADEDIAIDTPAMSAAVIGEMMLPVLRPRPDADGTVETARQAASAE